MAPSAAIAIARAPEVPKSIPKESVVFSAFVMVTHYNLWLPLSGSVYFITTSDIAKGRGQKGVESA